MLHGIGCLSKNILYPKFRDVKCCHFLFFVVHFFVFMLSKVVAQCAFSELCNILYKLLHWKIAQIQLQPTFGLGQRGIFAKVKYPNGVSLAMLCLVSEHEGRGVRSTCMAVKSRQTRCEDRTSTKVK